jgi:hypothetical protein
MPFAKPEDPYQYYIGNTTKAIDDAIQDMATNKYEKPIMVRANGDPLAPYTPLPGIVLVLPDDANFTIDHANNQPTFGK